ncbi:MAG: BPSS1780 family membrane protein [Burkholderiales bacterium]
MAANPTDADKRIGTLDGRAAPMTDAEFKAYARAEARRRLEGQPQTVAPVAATRSPAANAAVNPYAAPSARVDDAADGSAGEFIPDGQRVAGGRGLAWVTGGYELFISRPLLWVCMSMAALAINGALTLFPIIGPLFALLCGTALNGGLMIAAQHLDSGEEVSFGDLFAGLKRAPGALFAAGFLGALVMFGGLIIAVLIGGAGFASLIGSGGSITGGAVIGMLGALAVGLTVAFVYCSIIWFAPALIAIEGVGALAALRGSAKACLRNVWSMTVYSLVLMTVAFGGLIILGVLTAVAKVLGVIALALLALAMMPIVTASTYIAFREIFYKS